MCIRDRVSGLQYFLFCRQLFQIFYIFYPIQELLRGSSLAICLSIIPSFNGLSGDRQYDVLFTMDLINILFPPNLRKTSSLSTISVYRILKYCLKGKVLLSVFCVTSPVVFQSKSAPPHYL